MISSNLPHKTFKFPVGEMQVTVEDLVALRVTVGFTFTCNEDIIELLLFCDAAKRQGHVLDRLHMHYVPFSRQDRCNNPGEAFSLKVFCDLINALHFNTVIIRDPHSDVTPALLNNCTVIPQWEGLGALIRQHVRTPFYLVAPDAGALKKTHKLAQTLSIPGISWRTDDVRLLGVIESSKIRNTQTGEITGTVVHASSLISTVTKGDRDIDVTYVIPDDICDGGRTFIELAKELRAMGARRIHLYVTHGFFTKGINVFDGIIDGVYFINDGRKD